MNKARRTKLQTIADQISALRGEIEELREEEQAAFDNLPDSFQGSSRGEAMEKAVDTLDGAMDDLDVVVEALEEAIE